MNRREEVRKRIEERKAQDGEVDSIVDSQENLNEEPPGFVPIEEAVASKLEQESKIEEPPPTETTNEDGDGDLDDPGLETEITKDPIKHSPIPPPPEDEGIDTANEVSEAVTTAPEPLKAPETLPPLQNGSSRRNSSSSVIKSNSSREQLILRTVHR